MVDMIPVGRMGEKQELSNLAMYFLSNYSSWCSGTVVNFDGGQLPFMAGMFNPLVKVWEVWSPKDVFHNPLYGRLQ
jgi:2,4-dienoyl-CoA reductase